MRHGVKLNRLGRKTAHRKSLMRNLSIQLIQNKRIVTTLAKAKALRVFVEPLLNRSKEDNMANRRLVFSYLHDKAVIGELFTVVGEKIGSRAGGYTRIIKLAPRLGDAAEMAMIELVDFNEIYNPSQATDAGKKKTRRSRGAAKKTAAPAAETTPVAEEVQAAETETVAEASDVVADTTEAPAAEETPETPAAEDGANKEA